ncbi:MAG: class I SAM-dependent methyltransferase [Acidimicrobiales bacterium]
MGEGPFLFSDRRRAGSFGDDADLYDRVRPAYPPALVDTLMAERPATVLDVGCGTGIAARLFAARGCAVHGLEPDARMAAVARGHGVTVEDGAFESWDPGSRRFDLLIAAQSWHWVDPHAGATKAAAALRPGGRIGLFWNQANPAPPARDALRRAYARCAPELGRHSVLLGARDASLYKAIAEAVRATDRFGPVALVAFGHDAVYSTETWLELTVTHSDHRTLPPSQLAALLAAVRTEVDASGGRVPVHYETTLVTGRTHAGAAR